MVPLPEDSDGVLSADARDVVVELAKRSSAVLVGPGMRVTAGSTAVVSALLAADVPLVVDADGLNCLARLTDGSLPDYPEVTRRKAPLILTPHRRELGRLVSGGETPDSLASQLEAARKIVWADGGSEMVIVTKGCATGCVAVSQAILPKPGPAALATAGSGDVLAGMMASALAQRAGDEVDLALLAAYVCEIHGYAGSLAAERMGSRAVMATDVIDVIGLASDAVEEHSMYPDAPLEG